MIKGFNHITLSVSDLEESFRFYQDVLGLKAMAKRKQKSAYFLAGGDWLAIVQTKQTPPDTYSHLAFSVEQKDFVKLAEQMRNSGAKIWQENTSPGDSLYFLDPSGNRLELHAGSWRSRIEWLRQNPSAEVELFG
jgi:catechol 2,3-dioxygenase-like lactoylglutathione lyase family enzyme